MCQFKSAIIIKPSQQYPKGRLVHNPWTDSHEDLVRIFKLRDERDNIARVEFTPPAIEDWTIPENYVLRIDEARTPDWLTDEVRETHIKTLRDIIRSMIVSGDADLLCGGAYIIASGAKVACIKSALVHVMWDTSKVGEMRGTSSVGVMWDTSKVGEMRDTSSVGVMWGTSSVGEMRGASSVGEMRGASSVGTMLDTSKVGVMLGTSKVGVMLGTSKVGVMWGTSSVGEMRGASSVGEMRGASSVGEMLDTSSVGEMLGTSSVKNDKRDKPEAK